MAKYNIPNLYIANRDRAGSGGGSDPELEQRVEALETAVDGEGGLTDQVDTLDEQINGDSTATPPVPGIVDEIEALEVTVYGDSTTTPATPGIIDQLTADNDQAFQFAYDTTTQKYGYKVNGTFYPFEPTLDFAYVQAILNSGLESSMLSVGMEMPEITVSGEPMQWVIGAINHDQQHQVIFVPKWCLSTTRKMYSTNTNVGGWNSSDLRTWLNGDFYNSLPNTVKPYIADRTFQTSEGNTSTTLQSATDKIWLPREFELFGATTYAAATEHTDGGAEQFPIFSVADNRIKTTGQEGSAYDWWESSPCASTANDFCNVNRSGAANYNGASATNGVAPCFHMLPNN